MPEVFFSSDSTSVSFNEDLVISADAPVVIGGIPPSGTLSITDNGTYNVANYAEANVDVYQGFDYRGLSGLKFCDNTDTSIDLSALNTASFTSMSSMFRGCYRLTSLDVSNFNTSNVTNMNNLFWSCEKITSLDVSNFNTSNVTSMGNFCNACKKLTSLDLGSFNTSRVTNMGALASGCTELTSINLQSFTTTAATTMDNMFKGSSALTDVIWAINSTTVQPLVTAKGWDLVANTVPTDLNIWVRDELLNNYKTATNWSRYANCFKKISELPSSLQTLYNIDPTDYYTPSS